MKFFNSEKDHFFQKMCNYIWAHIYFYFYSRGVLEADQKRYASKHENALKEAEAAKAAYEYKLLQLKEERAVMDQREAEVESQRAAIEKQRLEIQDKWNHYQKEAEALRKAAQEQQNQNVTHDHSTKYSSLSSSQSTGSLHHAPRKPRNDRSRERRSADLIKQTKSKDSIPAQGQTLPQYRLFHLKSYHV